MIRFKPLLTPAAIYHGLAATQSCVNQGISAGAGDLDIVGEQRADTGGSTLAGDDDFRFDAVLVKQSFLLGDPHGAMKGANRTQPHSYFVLRDSMALVDNREAYGN
jgi:hypothetical protein